jgi:hypothetical protein
VIIYGGLRRPPWYLWTMADQVAYEIRKSLKEKPKKTVDDAVLKGVTEVSFLHSFAARLEQLVQVVLIAASSTGRSLELMEVMVKADSLRDDHRQLIAHLSNVAYPLHTADATAVTAALLHRVMRFSELGSQRAGEFGAEREIARREGRVVDANPAVAWVRAHFARSGRATIPQEAYLGRERGELRQECRTRVFPEDQAQRSF